MNLSTLDLFTIGIGPSSSHTVGPMRAAAKFAARLAESPSFPRIVRVEAHLYGSLALTGKGHGTDTAVLLGLEGENPETVALDSIHPRIANIESTSTLRLSGCRDIAFHVRTDLLFHRMESLPAHPNGMRFAAFDDAGAEVQQKTYYSVGGGFVIADQESDRSSANPSTVDLPYRWKSAAEILALCRTHQISFSELALRNESAFRPESETRAALLTIWNAMRACVQRGLQTDGMLPGGLKVHRRAPGICRKLLAHFPSGSTDKLDALDWVSMWAIAVNEENACGGRVVTAPTNGAAGIVPAVLHYLTDIRGISSDDSIVRFLLTAATIGMLFKRNASISGAEVGCQGEVGVACSMAAGALCEALGGTPAQTENAAEIGMEHNLGLTCDPIGGLVQIPCIERNATGAVKAIHAARLALHGDGSHAVSLDKVIATMRQTGADMSSNYKETSRGGLAVNIIEC